jgi:DNA-binding transcriptional ArsR family regulator
LLRIRFSGRDFARTQLARGADPLWELALSMHQLRLPGSNPFLDGWKQRTVQRLHPSGPIRRKVALCLALNPPRGYFPDFLTPFDGVNGFEAGIEAVVNTNPQRLADEIGQIAFTDSAPVSDVEGLRLGRADALGALQASIRSYHEAAIEPIWDQLSAAIEADRARRIQDFSEGGWAQLLDNLHPDARLRDDTLEIDRWGSAQDRQLDLDGRGLLIIPSYFKEQRQLLVLADTALPPVLLYPIDQSARLAVHAGHHHLPALIGRTRTLVLEATVSGGSTTAIALRVKISVPAASKHLQVLREAGLVRSTRMQYTVNHTVTPLGSSLLTGSVHIGSDISS